MLHCVALLSKFFSCCFTYYWVYEQNTTARGRERKLQLQMAYANYCCLCYRGTWQSWIWICDYFCTSRACHSYFLFCVIIDIGKLFRLYATLPCGWSSVVVFKINKYEFCILLLFSDRIMNCALTNKLSYVLTIFLCLYLNNFLFEFIRWLLI